MFYPGIEDIIGENAEKMEKIITTFVKVSRKRGFKPFYTPVFEDPKMLFDKNLLGSNVFKELYCFQDIEGKRICLRFDHTISLLRIVRTNKNLKYPLKRYAIGPVWRFEKKIEANRWREFWQADVDIVGGKEVEMDATCLDIVNECLREVGIKDFIFRFNSREVIHEIISKKVGRKYMDKIMLFLDKERINELKKVVTKKSPELIELVEMKDSNEKKLLFLKENFLGISGVEKLFKFYRKLRETIRDKNLEFNIRTVRGLRYYTSLVYEVYIKNVGCCGGGSYKAITYSRKVLPAAGLSLGLFRILYME
ncbi:MAG: ATP phosphoribosyltransferase regulatory subunit [Candidatus Aenigmatarchaeota archaeon]